MNNIKFFNFQNIKLIIFFVFLFILSSCKGYLPYYKANNQIKISTIYNNSVKFARGGFYEQSIKNLILLNNLYPSSNLIKKSKLTIIFCYYKRLHFDLALFQIKQLKLTYPKYKKDFILYITGIIYYDKYTISYLRNFPINYIYKDIRFAKKSFSYFKDLIEKCCYSHYLLNSMQRIIFLKQNMLQYEISKSEYYIKKKAYLSAINRSNFIIKNYDKNKNLTKVLKILLHAYKKSYLFNLEKEVTIIIKINKK